MSKKAIYFTIIILILIVLLSAYFIYLSNTMTSSTVTLNNTAVPSPNYTVILGSTNELGSFLADEGGKTLYYFANDESSKSNCAEQCLSLWPPFYAASITVPSSLNVSDFTQITRPDGINQTAYKGWPLYYYSGDKNSGDTNGDGIQNLWFIAASPFYNVLIMNNMTLKTYLADSAGRALYYSSGDIKGTESSDPQSKCAGGCLSTWPIFDAPQVIIPSLLKVGDFKEFIRSDDGLAQLSYKGRPLYYYSGDIQPGDTKGNGLNKIWNLAKP